MGRAFEFRKERKFKRWGNMARVFTRIGKEITIAAKAGGPDPDNNPRLRTLIQTARSENMPKENIERAIKRAVEHDAGDYEEIVYEGFGPHGIAFLIETATDNNMRTVANIRSYFTKVGGALGTQGCVSFMFDHKCVFKVRKDGPVDMDELELELIDYGVDDVYKDDEDGLIYIYGEFESFGAIQKYLEDNGRCHSEISRGQRLHHRFGRLREDTQRSAQETHSRGEGGHPQADRQARERRRRTERLPYHGNG